MPTAVMAAMSPVREPSGIVALAAAQPATLDEVVAATPALVVVLNGIQDAGNVGAIIRAADGCGATGVIAIEGTADPFGWKALRGAMGSTFRLPVAVRQPAAAGDRFSEGPARRDRRDRAEAGDAASGRGPARIGRGSARRRRRGSA